MQTKSVYPPHKQAVEAADAKASDSNGVLTCDDGNANIVFTKEIPFTDFPLPEITFYFTDKRDPPA